MTFKHWLFLAVILFVAGLVWGLTFSGGTSGPLSDNVNALKKLSDFLSPLPKPAFFAFIFLKNVLAVLAGFVLSPFFCVVPAAALVLNGGLLGMVAVPVVHQK